MSNTNVMYVVMKP